jgi:hypothetical protein
MSPQIAARTGLCRVAALIGLLALSLVLIRRTAAEPVQRPLDAAADAVREALQREIYGLAADRSELLASAALHAPQYAPAMWHRGYLHDAKRGWLKPEDYLQSTKIAASLALYEKQRGQTADTAEGNLLLADWCAEREMADQERAHLARVIELSPDHLIARQRLGFVRQGGNWILRAELARERSREADRAAAVAKWRPAIEEIRAGLEHRSQQRREFALAKLREVLDPEAVPAIEAVFATAADEIAVHGLDALAAIRDPDAALALARFAVYWPTQSVREAAAQRVGRCEFDDFVPQLVASMYTPVQSRFVAVRLPNGRIGYRHEFVREAQDHHEVMVLDTEYRRIAMVGGDRRDSTFRAFADAARTARSREQAAAAQNELTNRLNDRLAWVLKLATGQDLPAQPDAWWKWWNERNEALVVGSKPVSLIHDLQRVAVVDRSSTEVALVTSGGASSGGGQAAYECLGAGTPVWTVKGPREIEQVRVGDLVLSQHSETGELAFKPVLGTTVRPSAPLTRIGAGGDVFQASGGHLFWVAGEGWVKASELRSGQVLHSAAGPVHISTVEPSAAAETYNLVVADFSTYFVGYRRILSHDNTARQPTRALVPGLTQD